MPTPVPHYNFAKLPNVTSDRPLWDEKHEGGVAVSQDKIAGPGPHHVPMPPASWWPIIAAAANAAVTMSFMLGFGGGEFDPDALKLQMMVQGPLALIFLGTLLAWVKEDATHR